MKSLLSIRVHKIEERRYSQLYYENEMGLKDDERVFPPLKFGLDNEGNIVECDTSDYHHDIIENPGYGFIYIFDITNADEYLTYELEGIGGLDSMLDGYNLKPLFDKFGVEYFENYKNLNPDRHIILGINYNQDYWGDWDVNYEIVGYLNDDYQLEIY